MTSPSAHEITDIEFAVTYRILSHRGPPEDVKKRGEYPLYPNTVYAIEFSSTAAVPEWDNQDVRIGYEEDGVYTEEGCRFVDGRQTKIFLIK